MSSILFAVALTVCHTPISAPDIDQCDTYVIAQDDTWHTQRTCVNQGVRPIANEFADVWPSDVKLSEWLAQYDIKTPVSLITDYDFTCERTK